MKTIDRHVAIRRPLMTRYLRGVAALCAGLLLITLVVELIEFGLVAAVLGTPSTDPVVYFGARNRPWFLMVKLIYNTGAAVLAGYVAARMAGPDARWSTVVLVVVQSLGFIYALANAELRQWMPVSMWIALIVVTVGGIWAGARAAGNRR